MRQGRAFVADGWRGATMDPMADAPFDEPALMLWRKIVPVA
jgi:hypothetical protein